MAKPSAVQQAGQQLLNYVAHESRCPIANICRGEPTADGGYRHMAFQTWYATLDDVPCSCGLREALSAWERVKTP